MLRRHWNNQKCGFPHANEFLRGLSVNWARALKDVCQPRSRERQISSLPWAPTYLGPALYVRITELVVGWPEFQNKRGGGALYLYDENCFKFLYIKIMFKIYNTRPFYIRWDNGASREPDLWILSSVMGRSVVGRKINCCAAVRFNVSDTVWSSSEVRLYITQDSSYMLTCMTNSHVSFSLVSSGNLTLVIHVNILNPQVSMTMQIRRIACCHLFAVQ